MDPTLGVRSHTMYWAGRARMDPTLGVRSHTMYCAGRANSKVMVFSTVLAWMESPVGSTTVTKARFGSPITT